MEPALKQRLLGAAVIVALAVIIIPFLLDGSGTEPVSEVPLPPESRTDQQGPLVTDERVPQPAQAPQTEVVDQYSPPAPSAPEAASPEPTLPAEPTPSEPQAGMPAPAPAPAPKPAPAPQPATAAPSGEASPAPQPAPEANSASTEAGLHAWVVQVGSFSEQDKATALRDRLRKQQYKAFVERFKTSAGKSMYRVRVGPVPERAEAESLQQKLQAQEKLKGFVTQHP